MTIKRVKAIRFGRKVYVFSKWTPEVEQLAVDLLKIAVGVCIIVRYHR